MRTHYLALALLAACAGGDDPDTTGVNGRATYRDAATDHAGSPREAAAPPAQQAKLALTIEGSGTIPGVDPQCLADPAGRFEARYTGTGSLDDGGRYLAAFASGTIVTPSGCRIPELTVGVVTDIIVRAELTTTTQNCQTYCEAHARADAEAECGVTSSAASCRESAEASASTQCMTECTTQRTKIVAETSIGAGSLGEVDADTLRVAAFTGLEADLVFAALE